MNCRRLVTLAVCAAAAWIAIAAQAQEPAAAPAAVAESTPPRPALDLTYVELLTKEHIQRELALSSDQVGQIKKAFTDISQAGRDAAEKLMDAAIAKREMPNMQKINDAAVEQMEVFAKQAWSDMHKSLEQPQRDRLQQLIYQMRGPTVFLDEAANPLAITAEQKKKLTDVEDQMSKQAQEVIDTVTKMLGDINAPEDFDPHKFVTARLAKVLETFQAASLAVLSDQQRADWEKLLGPKFAFSPESAPKGETP